MLATAVGVCPARTGAPVASRPVEADSTSRGFVLDSGQGDASVRFVRRDSTGTAWFDASGVTFSSLRGTYRMGFPRRLAFLYGAAPAPTVCNYYAGRDQANWRTAVPVYQSLHCDTGLPGVRLRFYETAGELEYDIDIAPDSDAGSFEMDFGPAPLAVRSDGGLEVGNLAVHRAPRAYQICDGVQRRVPCRYELRGRGRVGFALGAWDRSLPLVIDPVVSAATYLGGGNDDWISDLTIDAEGNAYIIGFAQSSNYPTTPGSYQPESAVAAYVVSKIAADGELVFSTFLAGATTPLSGDKYGIALGPGGDVYVCGLTATADFPTTPGAFQTTLKGDSDAFVARLNASGGALVYSTLLGGGKVGTELQGDDQATAIAVDAAGAAYVVGTTVSFEFPVTPGAFQTERTGMGGCEGCWWAFAAKLSPDGEQLEYSTYLGGIAIQIAYDVAVDPDGVAYVVGETSSPDFPTTPDAFQPVISPADPDYDDAFLLALNADGTDLEFGTFLGGGGTDTAYGVALDTPGSPYVAGVTYSRDFPASADAIQTGHNGSGDAFVARFSRDGSDLEYATYLGGSNYDAARDVAVRGQEAFVVGDTHSLNFPTVAPLQPEFADPATGEFNSDAFVARIASNGKSLVYSTYLGGSARDSGRAIAVDNPGNAVVGLFTASVDMPFNPGGGALQVAQAGNIDLFVATLGPNSITPPTVTSVSTTSPTFKIKLDGTNFQTGVVVYIGADTTPWPSIKRKSDVKLVLKKGASLEARFPAGVPVPIRIVNPDGGVAALTYTHP
jgi:hypothetical protein